MDTWMCHRQERNSQVRLVCNVILSLNTPEWMTLLLIIFSIYIYGPCQFHVKQYNRFPSHVTSNKIINLRDKTDILLTQKANMSTLTPDSTSTVNNKYSFLCKSPSIHLKFRYRSGLGMHLFSTMSCLKFFAHYLSKQ